MKKTITPNLIESLFNDKVGVKTKKNIEDLHLEYSDASDEETKACFNQIENFLAQKEVIFSGEHRHQQWDSGWGENLKLLDQDVTVENLLPKYFGKYPFSRLNQNFIKGLSPRFEYQMLGIIQDWLFEKYFTQFEHVYEFGCGTGHNLFRLRGFNEQAELWGLDWAPSSQKILDRVNSSGLDTKIFGKNFDYFKPDHEFKIKKNSGVYTVASLEQIGNKHDQFINYMLDQKPALVVNIEPIEELLETKEKIDQLSVAYFKKRNYLSGYLTSLRNLEEAGKITIMSAKRTFVGSLFIEGYSVIVWRPLQN